MSLWRWLFGLCDHKYVPEYRVAIHERKWVVLRCQHCGHMKNHEVSGESA